MPGPQRATYWRRSFLALGVILVAAAVVGWFVYPTQYEAYALLKISSRVPTVLGTAKSDPLEFSLFKATQAQLIVSNLVMTAVLRDPAINRLPTLQVHTGNEIEWLRGALRIDFPGDTEVMRVAIKTRSPEDSIKIVNAVVKAYLQEIVQNEKSLRMANEAKLEQAYQAQVAEYKREMASLMQLERNFGTSGSAAAHWQKQLATQELNALVADRQRISTEIRDNNLQIELNKARAALQVEKPKAQTISLLEQGVVEELPLPLLEAKDVFLQQQLKSVAEALDAKVDELQLLERQSENVAEKKESLERSRKTKDQLAAEIERIRIERLAPPRIETLGDSILENDRGDAFRRAASCGSIAGLGLVLFALGLAIGRPRPLSSE